MNEAATISAPSIGKKLLEWGFIVATVLGLALNFLSDNPKMNVAVSLFAVSAIGVIVLAVRGRSRQLKSSPLAHLFDVAFSVILFVAALSMLGDGQGAQSSGQPFWAFMVAAWLYAWATVTHLSATRFEPAMQWLFDLVIPALFGITVLFLWEAIVIGAGIPFVLLPPPSAIGMKFMASLPTLAADFRQTVLKAVLFGFVAGSLAGFAVALLADRYRFLANALLPVGNMVSALPIIGIAPIMVIWFGFDWFSKAAVVIVMTFFPMLVNTISGLRAADRMERDLMHTYAANHWQTLLKLRLPAAMPFIFNALKINSTLAMIGAIVAEFFGTPVVGMGFRISTEVGRMNLDMVWAEIALAALTGSAFYGLITLIERATTFWHPSYRS